MPVLVSLWQQSCILEFDGASKGNPRPVGAAAVLKTDAGNVGLGIVTNNAAEYRAIILGLKHALRKGYTNIHVRGDSKLVCMQEHGVDQADLIAFLLELSFHTPGETLTGRDIPSLYVTLRDADGGTKEPLILCRGVDVGCEVAGHDVASG
ncbi:hypothetical protein GOBAR_DD27900 [Gossypium barbadense]|nr:hypothetical protein GOBAR_DD27900 [Gossypium barbadense]